MVLVAGSALFFSKYLFKNQDWESSRDQAIEQFNQGNIAEAENILLSTLKKAEHFPEGDPRLHRTLTDLVQVYNIQAKFSEAEIMILRVIALDEKLLGPDHPNVAASLNNLAENYRVRGLHNQAEAAYIRAIQILEKRFGPENDLVKHVRNSYHQFLKESGKPVQDRTPMATGEGPGETPAK